MGAVCYKLLHLAIGMMMLTITIAYLWSMDKINNTMYATQLDIEQALMLDTIVDTQP